jgi:hypothetical protein
LNYFPTFYYVNHVDPYQYSKQHHPDISPLIQSSRILIPTMYRAPPHAPRVLLHEYPLTYAMHHACVTPDHHIALVLPFDAEHVLVLRHLR